MEPIINPTGPGGPAPSFVRLAPEATPETESDTAVDVQSSAAQRLRRAGPFARQILLAVTGVLTLSLLFLHVAENREANSGLWTQTSKDTGALLTRLAQEPGLLAGWLADPQGQDILQVLAIATLPGDESRTPEGAVVDSGDPIEHRAILLLTHDGSAFVPLGDFGAWGDDLPKGETAPKLDTLAPERNAEGQATNLPVAIVEGEDIITAFVQYPQTDVGTPPLFLALQREAVPPTPWLLPAIVLVAALLGAALLLLPAIAKREALLEQQESAVAGLIRSKADALRTVNQLDRTKSDFLTAVSHRFRSPLQVVQGVAKLLSDPTRNLTPEMTVQLAKSLDTNATRLDELLQDLLDVDRLTRGTMEPTRRDLEVVSLVRDVVTGMDLTDRVNLPGTTVQGNADPSHVERILDHLLRNAVQYSPDDAKIDVRIEREDAAFLFAIEDRGPGIPKEHRLRVFDPLYRVEDGRSDPGVGIGLSLVQRLAAAHGGRAWAEPRDGGGSTIWVKIPDVGNDRGVDLWQLSGNVGT